MKDIQIDDNVMVTTDTFNLVKHENALVTVWPGCIWSYLKQDETIVGIAFSGTAKYAVDAFAETGEGVIGESKAGPLKGIQLFIGSTDITSKSTDITQSSVEACGYTDVEEFHGSVQKRLARDFREKTRKFDTDAKPTIFLGMDDEEKDVVLVTTKDGLVFTHDKVVSVLSKDGIVLVDGKRVSIGGKHRGTLLIDEDGIRGLEGLSHLGDRIGKSVGRAVSRGLEGICIPPIPPIPHMTAHHYGPEYDNVDDFDFDTYPDLKQYSLHRGR